MSRSENPPAFPGISQGTSFGSRIPFEGMTLRDYFAGQAIASIGENCERQVAAHKAYAIADAMLEERKEASNG